MQMFESGVRNGHVDQVEKAQVLEFSQAGKPGVGNSPVGQSQLFEPFHLTQPLEPGVRDFGPRKIDPQQLGFQAREQLQIAIGNQRALEAYLTGPALADVVRLFGEARLERIRLWIVALADPRTTTEENDE